MTYFSVLICFFLAVHYIHTRGCLSSIGLCRHWLGNSSCLGSSAANIVANYNLLAIVSRGIVVHLGALA